MSRRMVWLRSVFVSLVVVLLLLTIVFFWGRQPLDIDHGSTSKVSYRKPIAVGDTISLLTWNIGWLSGMTNNLPVPRSVEMYTNHLQQARQVLSALSPDLLLLQEVDFRSARSLSWQQVDSLATMPWVAEAAMAVNWNKRFVPFPYWPLGVQFGSMLSGQAVLTKGQVLQQVRHVLERPDNSYLREAFYIDRLAQVVMVQLSAADTLAIINVHLESWDMPVRQRQAAYVADLADSLRFHHAVVIAGDFNAMPPAMSNLFSPDSTLQYFLDKGFVAAGWQAQQAGGWPLTYSSEQPRVSIDHIFVDTQQILLLSSRVVTEMGTVSDHLPVMVKVRLKK